MPRSIADFLREHRNGLTIDEASDMLAAIVAAVTDEQRGGKMTLTISVKPLGKGDGLEVAVDLKAVPPKKTPGVSIFFATPDNSLTRQDPRQTTMELREVPAVTARNLA